MAARAIPAVMRQIMVKKLGNNFREVTEIVQVPVPKPEAKQALVRVSHVAINASDILFSAGVYKPDVKPPFPAGLEGMGQIVSTGEGSKLKIGQNVAFMKFGSFSEYLVLHEAHLIPVPSSDPVFLNLAISGVTASMALEMKGELKKGETVIVTAAAGATGQFAVQLAKLAGCHVIGTCSSDEKAAFLKSIGCDRTVIYTKESLNDVLKQEYPNGVDVTYECVGGEVFDTCLTNMSIGGRLIVIGAVAKYETKRSIKNMSSALPIPLLALQKSIDVRGFMLFNHIKNEFPTHIARLSQLITKGQLKVASDNGAKSVKGPFRGMHMIYDAVDYMYAKKNIGKVVVAIDVKTNSSL